MKNHFVFSGKWRYLRDKAVSRWPELTEEDLESIAGSREKYLERLRARYGYGVEKAETELDHFLNFLNEQPEENAE